MFCICFHSPVIFWLVPLLFSCYPGAMILSLSIRDFVLIGRLDIEPGNGFTALTGETGAGKSIILDALALALGGPADRGAIRTGAEQASVAVEFSLEPDHPAWGILEAQGIGGGADETLTLKRVVRTKGPARAFVNDQAVSAAILAELGETIVEIHGQHAASALMRPSVHRKLLDQFAGNEVLLTACATTWVVLDEARSDRQALEAAHEEAMRTRDWLAASVEEIEKLDPQEGEAEELTELRLRLMQGERVSDSVADVEKALGAFDIEGALSSASRATERICRLPGFEKSDDSLPVAARVAAEAVERAMIEVREASVAIDELGRLVNSDTTALDTAEARLFALRALARKHSIAPELLPGLAANLRAKFDLVEEGEGAMLKARKREAAAAAQWRQAAERLTAARTAAARQLEAAIAVELGPLKLGRAVIRVVVEPLDEDAGGPNGADRVEFDAETNPGAGFAPLRKIASGGEMARFSLALKCALAEGGTAGTLIFDEADQGVGGAVAAAIGERMIRLAGGRQVFAITHSPQVAASAHAQWLVQKGRTKASGTELHGLDDGDRLEEIARMLSGAEVTKEARAAAGRLLEDA